MNNLLIVKLMLHRDLIKKALNTNQSTFQCHICKLFFKCNTFGIKSNLNPVNFSKQLNLKIKPVFNTNPYKSSCRKAIEAIMNWIEEEYFNEER